jgi:hypothetical protein
MKVMFKTLSLVVVLALAAAPAAAGCGVKDTHEGTLKSVDADSNSVVVEVGQDGKQVKLTLTAKTEVTDSEGNAIEASALVGQKVQVVSEHAKIDSIKQLA